MTITPQTIEEYSQYYAKIIEKKRLEEGVDKVYLELNDIMLGEYLRGWVDADGDRFCGNPISIQFSVSGNQGIIWTVDFGAENQTVSKKILPRPNLFLSLTDVELFNGLVHRYYSLADLYLSSRIQMNRYPYETYHKVFFDSFFWWQDGAQVARNRERALEVGSDWQIGLIK